jgi:hypothetical protein
MIPRAPNGAVHLTPPSRFAWWFGPFTRHDGY